MNKSFYSQYASFLDHFILEALHEDIQDGDFSSLASFSKRSDPITSAVWNVLMGLDTV